ncbi:MAG: acyl transferase [Cyclobacteriaceae bacterium]|nr:acyl transferase [Cyclobacteriaceae bacterium]
MDFINLFPDSLQGVTDDNFEKVSLGVFRHQVMHNELYRKYVLSLGRDWKKVDSIHEIPFLPIEFYKYHSVKTGQWQEEKIFNSSGTTGVERSNNYVKDLSVYHEVSTNIFKHFYGSPDGYHIFGLLPSYLEQTNSSLVSMVEYLIKRSGSEYSGFFLYDHEKLISIMEACKESGKKMILFGVSFALLDLAGKYDIDFSNVMIIETGGMKGRGRELIRGELHALLKKSFKQAEIHSEYGMTELCSQAYALSPEKYQAPPWMRVLIREVNDPFTYCNTNETGVINVIDLANFSTCCFIETKDMGVLNEDLSFNILGRMDNSDLRGCSLMVE